MKSYVVRADSYFGNPAGEGVPFTEFKEHLRRCEQPIGDLIKRYHLGGKSILSIGAGAAFEENWFAQAGCELTMVDIDPSVEAYLASLPKAKPTDSAKLTYIIEDAGRYVEKNPDSAFDVLYISSFHPDEIRREKIQEAFCNTRTSEQAYNYVTWPAGTDPYHPMITEAFRKVKSGGLIILQHYRAGVYVSHNRHYLDDIMHQFERHGVTLLEVHCFRKSPSHLLVTACKGGDDVARRVMGEIAATHAIRSFHGRYDYEDVKNDVVKVFEYGNSDVSVEKAFPPAA